jgi:hypothetical protein
MHWTASTRPSSSSGMSRCLPTRRTSLRATRQLSSFKPSQALRSALTGGSMNIFKCGSEILNVFRDDGSATPHYEQVGSDGSLAPISMAAGGEHITVQVQGAQSGGIATIELFTVHRTNALGTGTDNKCHVQAQALLANWRRRPGTGAWRQARLRRSVRAVRTTSPSSCPRRCGSGSYGAPALISGIGLELAARFIANSSFPARVRDRGKKQAGSYGVLAFLRIDKKSLIWVMRGLHLTEYAPLVT